MSNITPENSIVDIYRESLSQSEIDIRREEQENFISAQTARQTKLDSAITKLKALGLTESEAKIIIGLE